MRFDRQSRSLINSFSRHRGEAFEIWALVSCGFVIVVVLVAYQTKLYLPKSVFSHHKRIQFRRHRYSNRFWNPWALACHQTRIDHRGVLL